MVLIIQPPSNIKTYIDAYNDFTYIALTTESITRPEAPATAKNYSCRVTN